MSDEELIEQIRRTLHARAQAIRPSHATRPIRAARSLGRTWIPSRNMLYASLAAVVVAAGAIVAIVADTTSHRNGTSVNILGSGTTTTNTPTSAIVSSPLKIGPATTTAAAGPPNRLPAGFEPLSVSFVSPKTGWALGSVPCGSGRCATVAETRDSGYSWMAAGSAPAISFPTQPGYDLAVTTLVRFANALDGWIVAPVSGPNGLIGANTLWATHDGGRSWKELSRPGTPTASGWIMALETSNGYVYAVVNRQTEDDIFYATVGSDQWTRAVPTLMTGAGPVPTSQVVLQGSAGWILNVDRTVTGYAILKGAGPGDWGTGGDPCSQAMGPALLAASSPYDLTAVCGVGQWGTPAHPPQGATIPSYWLYRSTDRGLSFSPVHQLPYQSVLAVTVAPFSGSTIVAVANPGLVASFDGGNSWQTVGPFSPGAEINYVGFTTATQAVAIESDSNTGRSYLLMSRDGGHTWTKVGFYN